MKVIKNNGNISVFTNRDEEIRNLYKVGQFQKEIAKNFGISITRVNQIVQGYAIRYCRICSIGCTLENRHSLRLCQNCHKSILQQKTTFKEDRARAFFEARKEKDRKKIELKALKMSEINERKARMSVRVGCVCFACKKNFEREQRYLNRKSFCKDCIIHLFRNPTLLGGRDRTREIRRMWDSRTCQDCRTIWRLGQRRFDVHHLEGMCGKKSISYDSYDDLPKLTTLCHRCHMSKHRVRHEQKKLSHADAQIRNEEIRRLLKNELKTRNEISAWYGFKKSNLAKIL